MMRCPAGDSGLPRALSRLQRGGMNVIVSLLPPYEAQMLEVADEALECERQGLLFLQFPIADYGAPNDSESFGQFVDRVITHLQDGLHVGVHCRAGIGRSGLFACAVLVRLGHRCEYAIDRVTRARGVAVPETMAQRDFLGALALAHL